MLAIPPASAVLLVVLACWTAGTIAFGAFTRIGGEVQAGHFKVIWVTGTVMAAVLAVFRPYAWGLAVLCALAFAAIYAKRDALAGWIAAAGAIVVTVMVASQMGQGVRWLPVFALAAAVMLGAVTNAMLLGHWHLNQPGLGLQPLTRLVWGLWVGIGVFILACGVLVATSPEPAARVGGVTALAFLVFAGVLNAMVAHLVKSRSIMSATGVLYLAILLCIVAAFTGTLGALA